MEYLLWNQESKVADSITTYEKTFNSLFPSFLWDINHYNILIINNVNNNNNKKKNQIFQLGKYLASVNSWFPNIYTS